MPKTIRKNARDLAKSLLFVAVLMVGAWLVTGMLGFHFALWSSLFLSLGLTVVLSAISTAWRSQEA